MNNFWQVYRGKIVIGIVILAILAGGGFFYYQNKLSKSREALKKAQEIENQIEEANKIIVPPTLTQCTAETVALDCEKAEQITVCGYDHTIYGSGKERDNVVEFKSACHYCKFYGLAEKNLMGTRIKGLGYETKDCNQGMYYNQR